VASAEHPADVAEHPSVSTSTPGNQDRDISPA
jgi:hypothetical protein